MINRIVILVVSVLFPLACPVQAYYRLANQGKLGLNIYSVERILTLDEEEMDLGTAALILSRHWGTRRTRHA